ncbi:MAG: hypothetical protein HC822_00130 [Oscillochloris sp.]|nr:hypothetical protein [Oscillochloris sp.]
MLTSLLLLVLGACADQEGAITDPELAAEATALAAEGPLVQSTESAGQQQETPATEATPIDQEAPVIVETADVAGTAASGTITAPTSDLSEETSVAATAQRATIERATTTQLSPTPAIESPPLPTADPAGSGTGMMRDEIAGARTELVLIDSDGLMDAAPINVEVGELFVLDITNRSANDVLLNVPLGETGQFALPIPADTLADLPMLPTNPNNPNASPTSDAGTVGIPEQTPELATTRVPSEGAENTGDEQDSSGTLPDFDAIENQILDTQPTTSLVMRFERPGTYTLTCMASPAQIGQPFDRGQGATAVPTGRTGATTATPSATPTAAATSERATTEENACQGELVIVVGDPSEQDNLTTPTSIIDITIVPEEETLTPIVDETTTPQNRTTTPTSDTTTTPESETSEL